jgi:hypothetical protein
MVELFAGTPSRAPVFLLRWNIVQRNRKVKAFLAAMQK